MNNDSAIADPSSATDSLDEYDIDESSSVDDGTLLRDRYLDRELSWLAFNQRVLELAEDESLPLLERANFLAIFASNLDEFFMVRVAGLKRRIVTGLAVPTNTGRAPTEVLDELSDAAHALQERHAAEFLNSVKPALDAEGIHIETWADLGPEDRERVHEIFSNQIFPVLMPLAVDPAHPFPYISGLSLNLSIRVRNPKTQKEEFARLKVPSVLPRFIQLPDDGSDQLRYIPLEDLISNHLGALFPGMEILAHHEFRVTRNEDVNVDEDESENLIKSLEKQILNRRFGPPIRLEITDDMDKVTLGLLVRELKITEQEVYRLPAPLDLAGLFQLTRIDRPALKYPRHVPITSPSLMPTEGNERADIFRAIARKDILLHHPYESFSTSVQSFLEQAAADPMCWPSSRPCIAPVVTAPSSKPSLMLQRQARPCSRSWRSRPVLMRRRTSRGLASWKKLACTLSTDSLVSRLTASSRSSCVKKRASCATTPTSAPETTTPKPVASMKTWGY